MTAFERLIIRKRKALTARSKIMFKAAIRDQYIQALKIIENTSIDQLTERLTGAISSDPIEKAFTRTYSSASDIAMMWRKKLLPPKKDVTEEIQETIFERSLANYALTKAGKRIVLISETTESYIISATQKAVTTGLEEGLGISKIKDLILSFVNDQYKSMTDSRAGLIAQTEIITASNQATRESAESTGYEYVGFWSTSGLSNVRDSHRECEQWSIDNGGVKPGDTFPNGLEFPGDPTVDAPAEVCNCHCTYMTELV